MRKEGAIILGIGGDNSIGAAGTFYEGVMTSGYPSDATENAVQANIIAAGYATSGAAAASRTSRSWAASPAGAWTCRTAAPPTAPRCSCGTAAGGANQRWTYTSSKQLTVYGNKCLDANGQGTSQRHRGDHLGLQRAGQPAVERQLQRHHHRRAVRAVPGRQRRPATANGTKIILWACNGGPTSSGACAADPRAAGAARTPPCPPRSGTSRWAAPGRAEVRMRLRSATPSDPPHT